MPLGTICFHEGNSELIHNMQFSNIDWFSNKFILKNADYRDCNCEMSLPSRTNDLIQDVDNYK